MLMQSFADLGVSSAVCRALADRGINEPFAVQRLVIGDVLAGRDVLVKSPTGSGKTLAFGIPIAERIDARDAGPVALVLAPTRELALQITDELRDVTRARGLRITAVYGGVGLSKQAAAAARSQIIVATPGRLEDLLQRGSLRLSAIRILVLDEADRMLDMGFRPAVDRIVRRCPRARQTLFFSATLDGVAGELATSYTSNPLRREHEPTASSAAMIEHRFVAVTDAGRVDALLTQLAGEGDRTLVFVRTKRGADRLVKRLDAQGVTAAAIHGNKSQRQREQALGQFESGHIDTLVATDIAARGIDIDDISHVVNFDPPGDHDVYLHRVGRTGRAGRTGIGVTFFSSAQRGEVRQLAHRLGIEAGPGHGPARDPRPATSGPRRARRSRRRPAAVR
jgi:superfamily II DNA/RNA helicase